MTTYNYNQVRQLGYTVRTEEAINETYMLIIECNGNTQSGDTIYLESHNICIKGQESYYFYDNTGLFGTLTIADSIEKAKDYLYNYFSKQNIKVNITI